MIAGELRGASVLVRGRLVRTKVSQYTLSDDDAKTFCSDAPIVL